MKTESGNILLYIIGAIFLIGLLTVLVRGSTTPGAGIDEEKLVLKASQVQAYAAELERGVRFIMQNGHSETDISFAHANHSSAYGVYGTTPTAEIFHPQGGGVEWRDNDAAIQTSDTDWVFTASDEVGGVGSTCAAASCLDLLAILPNVTQDFCLRINTAAGVTNPSGAPPQDTNPADVTTVFAGTYTFGSTLVDAANYLRTKNEGCFEGGGTPAAGTYHYYKVLLAR